jgi:hypothetical protein
LIYQLTHADLPMEFPPIRTLAERTGNLPLQASAFIGRGRELEQTSAALDEARLVTLTGPGGIGKTRLAVAVGERLRDRFGSGVVFVPLSAVTEPGLVLDGVARAVGASLGGAGSPLQALAELFGDDPWILILDNLEQVVSAAGDLAELLSRCRGVAILATSRTVLGLAAEREYPVPPLPLPADTATISPAELESAPAVALFVDRARGVRPGFALTAGNATAVAEICRRLEGLPLAIELAAARTRLLDPAGLLSRLTASLDSLVPERWTFPSGSAPYGPRWSGAWVCSMTTSGRCWRPWPCLPTAGPSTPPHAWPGWRRTGRWSCLRLLARHSLVQLDLSGDASRCRMLETVRAFVAEGRRRRRRGPTAPRRVQRVANSTAGRGPTSSPDPPDAGGRPIRSGVRCRVPSQPAGGGRRHQRPAR